MKRLLALTLAVLMIVSLFAACGKTEPEAPKGADLSGETVEALVNKIYESKMPEFALMTMPVDLADAEMVAWQTGISDPALLKEAVISESMMGSQAYSLVLARVADAAKAEEVARMMLDNINPAKWICVQADDMAAAIKGDLVMFIMVDTQLQLTAQSMVDAFAQVAGGVDNTLTK